MKRAGMAWAQDSPKLTLKNSSSAAKAARRSIMACIERETTAINARTLDSVIMNPRAGDALAAPGFLDEVPESLLLLAATT